MSFIYRYYHDVGRMVERVAYVRGPADSISSCDLVRRNRLYIARSPIFNAQCIKVRVKNTTKKWVIFPKYARFLRNYIISSPLNLFVRFIVIRLHRVNPIAMETDLISWFYTNDISMYALRKT